MHADVVLIDSPAKAEAMSAAIVRVAHIALPSTSIQTSQPWCMKRCGCIYVNIGSHEGAL